MRHWTPRSAALSLCVVAPLCLAQMASPAPASAPIAAAAAAPATVRIRGTVQSVSTDTLVVKDRSGDTVTLALPATLAVNEVFPIAMADIKPGSFIGTAALPQPDGTRRAIAVTVFPEAARGSGEGDYGFDLMPQSTMTNATVAELSAVPKGREMRLKHKGGEARIVVPDGVPVVSFQRGDRSLLVVGASVSIAAQALDGKPTALRVNAGRNGFALPY